MDGLPIDIWLCVTEHLEDEELQALIGVNRFFYSLGMDTRYGDVLVDTSSRDTVQYMDHLMRTQVAKRVKKLVVHLESTPPTPKHRSPSPGVGKRLFARIRTAVRKVISDRRPPADSNPPQEAHSSSSLLPAGDWATIQKLRQVFACMTNVEDFRLVTWTFPVTRDLAPTYRTAWSTFGDNLLRVSFCSHAEGHKALIDSSPKLARLETLELEFSDNIAALPTSSEGDAEILVGTIVPWVDKLAQQVRTLKIRSWGKLDLSRLFLELSPFPVLESTLIRIPFNHALRADPSGLTRLLRESHTLTNIALRLTPIGLALDPSSEDSLCEWLQDLLSDPRCFSAAKEIDICPTHLPGGMDILRLCIEHSAQRLTTFKLRDRYLHPTEVLSLVPKFQPAASLTRLRLNVFKLIAPMFDAFAANLLTLRILWLSVGDVDSASSGALGNFRDEMKARRYDSWCLWDLSIWQGGFELDGETMLAIAQSIPSLRSFWESGHKRLPC